jgi:superfamily I DNA/RNA helicase
MSTKQKKAARRKRCSVCYQLCTPSTLKLGQCPICQRKEKREKEKPQKEVQAKMEFASPPKTYGEKQQKLAERLRAAKDSGVDNSPHLIVEARAGTGKTTTLIEGLKLIKGILGTLTPSLQQEKVWEAMSLSKGRARTICFVAFNKSIATELQSRVPQGCDAMTMHSMGFKAVQKAFNRVNVNSYRVQDIISEILGKDIRELRRTKPEVIKATEELVGLCKMNLVGIDELHSSGLAVHDIMENDLARLAAHYDVDMNGNSQEVFDLVPRVLERCKDVARDGCIDFNDMIWLPVILGLNVYKYDLLLCDELQDFNPCQQRLAIMAGRRIIGCGDRFQSIYGFAGADCNSIPNMEKILGATERGCKVLPLTVTRRCGKAIVEEARKIVPDFEAHESNPMGKISRSSLKGSDKVHIVVDESTPPECLDPNRSKTLPHCQDCRCTVDMGYRPFVKDGDMILCRCNAPLVSECFKFLRSGKKANIQGRDVGQGLIKTVKKVMAKEEAAGTGREQSIIHLHQQLSDWLYQEKSKESAKRNPNEQKLINLQDRFDCLICFTEGADSVDDVIFSIEKVFTDDKTTLGIMLSSVHKSKGLEAKRVFILTPEEAPMPHPMSKTPWGREQEMNLKYVAITRAIEELVWVS